MYCPKCNHEMADDMNFCPRCGTKIERCPHCHQPLKTNARFCQYCGKEVQQSSSVGGYYEPIQMNEDIQVKEEKIKFKDIPSQKKVNWKIIIISVLALLVLTGTSLFYLYGIPSKNAIKQDQNITQKTEIQLKDGLVVGNINQEGHVASYKDKIYITNNEEQLVVMDKNLENQKVLIEGKVNYLNIVNDMIYYTDDHDYLCSVDLEGKNKKTIVNVKSYYIQVIDNKIYYQYDGSHHEEYIYVYDLKTKDNVKVNNRNSYNINVVGQTIYYTSSDGVYSIKTNGKGEEKLVSGTCYQLIYQDGKLYYTSGQYVMSFDLQTKKIAKVIDESSQLLNMNENYLFYYSSQGLNRYDFKTQKIETIYNGSLKSCEILGNHLVLTVNQSQSETTRIIMDLSGQNQQRIFKSQNQNYV